MKPRYGLFVLILCCVSGLLNAQVSAKKLKNEGDGYFKYSKYHEALNMFLKYQRLKKEDLDVRYKIGLCYYFTNEVEEAKKYLQYVLDNNKKADPKTYYYLGRVYHSEYDFESAIKYYKQYLKETKATNLDRRSVKDAIRRCAMGLRLAYRDEIALVENLGDEVNTRGDDFAPVPSPNFNNKLYFSSSREGNIGGLRDNKGLRNEKYGDFSTDIYSTVVINGRWTATTPMSSLINSPRNDVALDFSMNGGVMYYYKGPNLAEGEILVDTFANGNEDNLIPVAFNGPVDGARRENDLYFFNDTTLLFSSRMPGGYGGDDLYLTTLRDGNWTEPENLGPMINSAYDEKTPFLAIDGRTLYFSSNNRQSIGGLDMFPTPVAYHHT
ncbi:MAG: tetratricopeptide repeat protein [Bacteroidota bacterium]